MDSPAPRKLATTRTIAKPTLAPAAVPEPVARPEIIETAEQAIVRKAPQTAAEAEHHNAFGELKVKYFGRELPPRCELHGCYLTDDGEHFYCTNFACNKHKYRRTKHTKYSRYSHLDTARPHGTMPSRAASPPRRKDADMEPNKEALWPLVHYACPECKSRDIDMRLLEDKWACGSCKHEWK